MPYKHNSPSKDKIRKKWVHYIKTHHSTNGSELRLITLPAGEMQDIILFSDEGLIQLEKTETGAFLVKKGKITCFETKADIYRSLVDKLANANVKQQEIASYFQEKYNAIMRGNGGETIFPADVINLDFDGNISKSSVEVQQLIKMIFDFQKKYTTSFSLFLTFPQTDGDDAEEYIKFLKEILDANLSDPATIDFQNAYKGLYNDKKLTYEQFIIISLAKAIVKEAAHQSFEIKDNHFCTYGKGKRKRMISLLFHFEYVGLARAGHSGYLTEVLKTLYPIEDVEE